MGYGLLDVGADAREQALRALATSADNASRRDLLNQGLKTQRQQAQMSAIGTGAGIGAMIGAGTSVGGPVGGLIGAGIGFLSSLF